MRTLAVLAMLSRLLLRAQAPPFVLEQSYPVAEPLAGAFSIATGDLNGDGVPEILFGRAGGVAVFDPARGAFGSSLETRCDLQALVLADFDRDGALDLASYCSSSGVLEIRGGDGSGGFRAPSTTRLQSGSRLPALAVADLDRDGNPDLAVAQPGALALLFGVGDGSFRPARRLPIASRFSPANPSSVVAADFDNNGIVDLATANLIDDDDVSIFLGAGGGEFKPEAKIRGGGRPTALTATDFDRDGNTDLIVAAQDTVLLLAGRGDGTFIQSTISTDGRAMSVAARDLNGDELPDLAVGMYYGGVVGIYLNKGGRSFEPKQAVASVGDVYSVALVDVNGDSLADLIASSVSGSSGLLAPGLGGGAFEPPAYIGAAPANLLSLRPYRMDGRDTLGVVADRARAVTFLRDGVPPRRLSAQTYLADVRFGDFDNDGITDLLAAGLSEWTAAPGNERGAALVFYRGNAEGGFDQAASTVFSCPVRPGASYETLASLLSMVSGDFNGDGILDAAVSNDPLGQVEIYLGARDGTFRLAQGIPKTYGPVVAGDFNGDKLADLAVAVVSFNGPSRLTFFWGSREGSPLREQNSYPVCDGGSGRPLMALAAGDFDGDKALDVAAHCGVNLEILRRDGQSFQLVAAGNSGPPGGGMPLMVVADFDGDGNDDIAEARVDFQGMRAVTRILVHKGGAGAKLAAPVSVTVAASAVALAALDADGDRKPDLALSDAQTGRVMILRNQF